MTYVHRGADAFNMATATKDAVEDVKSLKPLNVRSCRSLKLKAGVTHAPVRFLITAFFGSHVLKCICPLCSRAAFQKDGEPLQCSNDAPCSALRR